MGAIGAALGLGSLPGRGGRVVAIVALVGALAFGPRLAFDYRQPAYENTLTYVRAIGALVPRGAVIVGDPWFFVDSQLHIALFLTPHTPPFSVGKTMTGYLRDLRVAMKDRAMFWIGPSGRQPASTPEVKLVPVANYSFGVATRRMEPYDDRDDLGRRE